MNNPPKQFRKRSSEQGDRKWQQDEQEHEFEIWSDFFWRKEWMGAGISGGGHMGPTRSGGAPRGVGRTHCLVDPTWVPSTYYCTHTLRLPQEKIIHQLKPVFQLILLPFSISLLKAPFTKLLWGIVLRYVTPPMVQLVFVLVLYLVQFFAAQVTLFLSLHVKFMWSKVFLMHHMASRHLQEQLLSILLSFVHFSFESLKILEFF